MNFSTNCGCSVSRIHFGFGSVRDYLTNRYHFVQVDDSYSDCLHVLSGVPQGIILGPLLLLVYINDIPLKIPLVFTYIFAETLRFILKRR